MVLKYEELTAIVKRTSAPLFCPVPGDTWVLDRLRLESIIYYKRVGEPKAGLRIPFIPRFQPPK